MKKAIVLLLALAVLGGAAFAQTPSLSASATLTWGMNLDNNSSGFTNAYTASVTIPFAVANKTTAGEGVHGYISVSNITFKLTDDPVAGTSGLGFTEKDADGNAASISAKIVADNLYMMVYNFTDLNLKNYAAQLLGGDVKSDIDASAAGVKVGISGDYAVAFILNSAATGTDFKGNPDNYYSAGVHAVLKLVPDVLTADVMFAYDVLDATKEMYIGGKLPVTLGDLTLTPAFDVAFPDGADMSFDARLTAKYLFAKTTSLTVDGYWGGDEDLEAQVKFVEDAGLVTGLYFEAGFAYYDALETAVASTWKAWTDVSYKAMLDDKNYIKPYAYFSLNSADVTVLKLGVAAALIPNTVFTLQYHSDDLQSVLPAAGVSDKGLITFATKITL